MIAGTRSSCNDTQMDLTGCRYGEVHLFQAVTAAIVLPINNQPQQPVPSWWAQNEGEKGAEKTFVIKM